MSKYKETAFLLLGGNVGAVELTFTKALKALEEIAEIEKVSGLYQTQPWGMSVGTPAFLNQAVQVSTSLSPLDLLVELQRIEAVFGRKRAVTIEGYQNRTLDIDILLYGKKVVDSQRLRIPHPRLQERQFALKPLQELAPSWPVPPSGETVLNFVKKCKDTAKVVLVEK